MALTARREVIILLLLLRTITVVMVMVMVTKRKRMRMRGLEVWRETGVVGVWVVCR